MRTTPSHSGNIQGTFKEFAANILGKPSASTHAVNEELQNDTLIKNMG
jgi:hypothetical protein